MSCIGDVRCICCWRRMQEIGLGGAGQGAANVKMIFMNRRSWTEWSPRPRVKSRVGSIACVIQTDVKQRYIIIAFLVSQNVL